MQTRTDMDPPKHIHHLTLKFAHLGWFIKNESRRLYNFSVSTYQVKFNNTNVVNGYHMVLINQRCKQLLWCMIYNVI